MRIELELHNRLINDADLMRSRIDCLKAYASEDAYQWRQVPIALNEEFLRGASPVLLVISTSERFLRFCNNCDDCTTELTLGPLVLESRSRRLLEAFSSSRFREFCAYFAGLSNAQLLQDLLPLYFLGLKPGFFFEAGMADGITLSNTFILEKLFGWEGIGVEPLPEYFLKAEKSRRKSHLYNCALVPDESIEMVSLRTGGLLSSLDQAMPDDSHSELRTSFGHINVVARSFMSLMRELNQTRVDFLSLDLEGLEFPILESIDFASVLIQIIAVEHNHTSERRLINDHLLTKGYIRVFEDISNHDDFYVSSTIEPFDWNAGNLFAIKRQPAAARILASSLTLGTTSATLE